MLRHLSREPGRCPDGEATVPRIFEVGSNWHPPTTRLSKIDFLLAFAFGNRPPANGGDPTRVLPEPGPMNEDLADTVMKVLKRAGRKLPVYAQWEIARHLNAKHGFTGVVSIEPVFAPDGTITYLSTDGVIAQVAELRANELRRRRHRRRDRVPGPPRQAVRADHPGPGTLPRAAGLRDFQHLRSRLRAGLDPRS
ncbi:MAG: hypothetical protein R2719_01220 [Micropruina sp.]